MRPANDFIGDLHELVELSLRQRLSDELEPHRVGHEIAQAQRAVRDHHLLGIELLANAARVFHGNAGELGIDFQRLVARIHPFDRLAIGAHEASERVGLARQAVLVGDENTDGMVLHQRQLGRAR